MRKTTVECDAPDCTRVEIIVNPAMREVPDGWISLRVEVPVRSWPFGARNRHFCSWHCVSSWGGYLDDTNGEGHQVDLVDVDALARLGSTRRPAYEAEGQHDPTV